MIIIPEARAVVILTPRAGSTALKEVLLRAFPRAFMPYRHMEADGVPAGYECYQKYGLVREPLTRLWSMWHYILRMKQERKPTWDSFGIDEIVAEADKGFMHWLVYGTVPFARSSSPTGITYPQYHTLHPMHEFRKSQRVYLRPDLGTSVFPFRLANNMFACLTARAADGRENVPALPDKKVNAAAPRMPHGVKQELNLLIGQGHCDHLLWDHDRAGGWF